ncbi:MAG TPA: hypothetical protein VFS97_01855 [Nitrososphaeraceae archaeon]|nr:hypothetical protein [Nitrososphaeraceae archaeon]
MRLSFIDNINVALRRSGGGRLFANASILLYLYLLFYYQIDQRPAQTPLGYPTSFVKGIRYFKTCGKWH